MAVNSSDQRQTRDAEAIELRPGIEETNQRLDRFVASVLSDMSRTYVQQLIQMGQVRVDGIVRRPTFRMTPGEVVTVIIPPPVSTAVEPEAIPLSIQYEDDDVIVLNKPPGFVVHPAPGHRRGTLVNALCTMLRASLLGEAIDQESCIAWTRTPRV